MNRYFITGTDTHCGKTFVVTALLRWYQKMHQKAHAIKPVASGEIEFKKGCWINEDVLAIKNATAFPDLPLNLFSMKDPVSPHLAAKEAGITICQQQLLAFCLHQQFEPSQHLLIEGAGGLLVPLNEKETWLDFLICSQIPVILVAGMRLGCLNHAFLTASVLKTAGIACIGWIANCLDDKMLALDENINTLIARLEFPLLGKISHHGEFNPNIHDCNLTKVFL